MVGAVIGRGGQNIKDIGWNSNTEISLFDQTAINRMKHCNISGTQNEIDYAVKMINEKIIGLRNQYRKWYRVKYMNCKA